MSKKIVIVPACTDLNRGDQALVWETGYLLRDAMGEDTQIDIVDYGNNEYDRNRQSFQTKKEGFNVIRNITENPKRYIKSKTVHNKFSAFLCAGFIALLDFFRHLITLFFPYDFIFNLLFHGKDFERSFKTLKASDAVVIKGGGYLHTYGKLEDLYYLWFGLYYVLLAKRLRKKVIVFPNSIGPIKGFFNQLFFKYVIRKVDLLFVRERISELYLKSIGINNAIYAFDLGYYSKAVPLVKGNDAIQEANITKTTIGITLRPYRFPKSDNPKEKYSSYINAIAKFCNENYLGKKFYFIIQVKGPSAHETDMIAINDVINQLDSNVDFDIVDDEFNYKELLSVYSKMDYVIGTRFHSVIFSQVMGVPSIAIAYGGNKSRGIMRELGLEKYVVDIEDVTSVTLSQMMLTLEKEKNEYIDKLVKAKETIQLDRIDVIERVIKTLSE